MQHLGIRVKQKGAVIILMAFIIGLGAIAYLLHSLDPQRLRLEQDKKTMQTLNEAKQALIAWSVSHPNAPGLMPYPDRNSDNPTYYDGLSDCPGGATLPSHLIGRLPWRGGDYTNCNILLGGLGKEFKDASNEPLWYAVSENLVHIYTPSGDPIVNPSIVNNPPYGAWLEVYSSNGQLISNRVAVVIIAPGAPLDNQDRTGGVKGATDYLDRFDLIVGGGTKSNRAYAGSNEDFYIGEDSKNVSANNTTFVKPYYFNDKLIYITIDELIAALSQRAAAEAKAQLKNYKTATSYYPFASAFVSTEHYQRNSQLAGFLPTQLPTQTTFKSCSVTYASANSSFSTCDSSSIASVDFTRTGGTFTSTTGSECTRTNANKTCSCNITTGTSRCNGAGGRRFTCSTLGCVTTGTLPGVYVFNGVFKFATGVSPVKVNKESGICTGCGSNAVTCTSTAAANGDFAYDVTTVPAAFNSVATNSALPAWFTTNNWQNYLFYSVSNNCINGQLCNAPDINVGGRLAVQVMVAGIGSPIIAAPFAVKGSAQTGAGCDIKDYLDSNENTNLDTTFEPNNKQRTSNYNDQTFVVAP